MRMSYQWIQPVCRPIHLREFGDSSTSRKYHAWTLGDATTKFGSIGEPSGSANTFKSTKPFRIVNFKAGVANNRFPVSSCLYKARIQIGWWGFM